MKITFNTYEYNYLSRVSARLMQARKNKSEREMAKGTNAIVKELATKFSVHVQPENEHTVPLKRTHLRYLQSMLNKSIEVIDTRIIPEYKARPNSEQLGSYIDNMNTTRTMLQELVKKIEAAL